jgi:uncharacterized RDD family membrane protein YckC
MTMHSLSDIREDTVQKKREVSTLEFAGFWRRLTAALIDLFALAVISSVIFMSGNFLSLIVNIAYFVGFWIRKGQTPGKMLMNIKLVRMDASNLTFGIALLRYLGYIVSGAVFLIGFIWIAFDNRKQGFHDKIAETYVVRIPESPVTAPSPKLSLGS